MSDGGLFVVGCIVKTTVLALSGLALGSIAGRRSPASGAAASVATLASLLVIPPLALSPWPRWWSVDEVLGARGNAAGPVVGSSHEVTPRPLPGGGQGPIPAAAARPPRGTWIADFVAEFDRELRRPFTGPHRRSGSWPDWVAVGVAGCAVLGLGRFVLGFWAVVLLRRRSRPLEDPGLLDSLELGRAEMGCLRRVALRECPDLATPATIGWRSPEILLPVSWREWDEHERKVVLAHELAHIARGDYLAGMLAQCSLAIHFYHPLAHWLAARLRLQQELAADAWGARLVGGDRTYVTTLAQMALRQAERPLTWPARPFLPARGTFLRRLEMLRDPKRLKHAPTTMKARAAIVGALAAVALLVSGFRSPAGLPAALAQGAAAPRDRTHSLAFVPSDAVLLISARPADLLTLPDFQPITKLIDENLQRGRDVPLAAEEIDQVAVFWLGGAGDKRPPGTVLDRPSGVVVRSTKAQDWKRIAAKIFPGAEEVQYQEKTYHRSQVPVLNCAYASDDRTLVIADELLLRDMIKAGPAPTQRHRWDEVWKGADHGQLAIALDCAWLRESLRPALRLQRPLAATASAFAPLWEKTRTATLGISATEGLKIDAVAACESSEDATEVSDTIKAVLTLGRNAMRTAHQQARVANRENRTALEPILLFADVIDPLLDKAEVKTAGSDEKSRVLLRSTADVKVASLVNSMFPPIRAARAAARRAQSMNNLKQIGLAFHNYQALNGRFPASAGYAPGSQHPHSWRVAILPFIEQKALYDQYHFDEPWDSDNNRRLLDRMPAIYRAPDEDGRSRSPSYFVLTGPDTLFPSKEGLQLSDVTDGISNTLLAVEARREIPWTKPEDIPFELRGPLPKLGGYFDAGYNVLFADGSVRFLSEKVDPGVFRALVTRGGGEHVPLP